MLDFLFAVIAAGLNSADAQTADAATAQANTSAAALAPIAAPEEPAQTAPASDAIPVTPPTISIAPGTVVIGQSTLLQGQPTTPLPEPVPAPPVTAVPPATVAPAGMNMAVVPADLVAEPQTPSGKFITATEVRPILNATKGTWIAVREYEGQDYLYVTHLWSWRCGLAAMAISVNDEPMQNWPLPPCHLDFSTPNAILEDDGVPFLRLRAGSVQTVTIQVVYDDLSMDAASFERGNVLIP